MRLTVKTIFLMIGMILIFTGCGREKAEKVLLKESTSQEEEESPEETKLPETTQIPEIQVICSCQCQNRQSTGDNTDSQTATGEYVAPTEVNTVDDGKVNINTADSAQLQTLDGIGETRANAIISYRENYGRFQSIEDIMNVEGIKNGVFSKIKDKISVG